MKAYVPRSSGPVSRLTNAKPGIGNSCVVELTLVFAIPKSSKPDFDLLDFPAILFHETGYSLHTLRQASRRSWRIGQRRPVEVKFFAYKGTMQEVCLRLMGKKLLVALAMEGKFASEGL